jgi:hypothetical protein
MSFYSAVLGRAIAEGTRLVDAEEAFISALFHNLGRILAALYLPDEVAIITASRDSDSAALEVLGMSYAALGAAVAETLNLPTKLALSLTRVPGPSAHESMTEAEKLACVATLANNITDTLAAPTTARDKREAIKNLVRSYGPRFAAIEGQLEALISNAVSELGRHSRMFQLDLPSSPFVFGLGEWRVESLLADSAPDAVAAASSAGGLLDIADTESADEVPETVLTRGLHEITSLLVTEFSLDDVLRVILETIYRALGVGRTRTIFLLKDASMPVARFRFGLGPSPADMRAWSAVPLTNSADLFSIAIQQQKDLVIRDTSAREAAALLPEWYQRTLPTPRYIVLLPLVVDHKALGLFCVEGDQTSAHLLTPALLNYLKVLRGQAVVAIHHRAARPGGRRP